MKTSWHWLLALISGSILTFVVLIVCWIVIRHGLSFLKDNILFFAWANKKVNVTDQRTNERTTRTNERQNRIKRFSFLSRPIKRRVTIERCVSPFASSYEWSNLDRARVSLSPSPLNSMCERVPMPSFFVPILCAFDWLRPRLSQQRQSASSLLPALAD